MSDVNNFPIISERGEDHPKIVFFNRFFWPDHSATSQILTDLAIHLSRQGRDVSVVTSRLSYDDPRNKLPTFEYLEGVAIYRVATTAFGRKNMLGRAIDYLSFYITASILAYQLAQPGSIFVVKTDPPLISIPLSLIARIRRVKIVNWLQDLYPELAQILGVTALGGTGGRLLQRLRNWSLINAHMNVAIGEKMASRLLTSGVHASRITVVHNWTDDHAIQPWPVGANQLRSNWGIKADQFIVGYSGNLGRAHDAMTVLNAARELHQSGHSWISFLFIGGGFQTSMVAKFASDHGLTNIIFKPYQDRSLLPQSLSVADVHWITLKPELEGLIVPSKLYSAAASGRPLLFVGEKEGQIGSMLSSYGSGITVTPGENVKLVEAILSLASDPEKCAEMGARARKMIDDKYTMNNALEKWLKLLN